MNTRKQSYLYIYIALLVCLLPSTVSIAYAGNSGSDPTVSAAQHHLVSYSCPLSQLRVKVRIAGGRVDRIWDAIGVARVSGLKSSDAASLVQQLGINAVERDIEMQWIQGFVPGKTVAVQSSARTNETGAPSDAAFFQVQWNMEQIDAETGWKATRGLKSTRIAILSTGISPSHIDLRGRFDLETSVNLSPSNPADRRDYTDRHMQGTLLSALISSNSIGVASIAPDVTLVGVKIFDDDGRASVANIIDGLLYAVDKGRVDIINLSIDNGAVEEEFAPLAAMLSAAVHHAISKGVMVVASVGICDENASSHSLAGSFISAGAMVVGPTARAQEGASGTVACYADSKSHVSVYAPGGSPGCEQHGSTIEDMIISALSPEVAKAMELPSPQSWYVFSSSAGVSAAHVTGVAALIKTVACDSSPHYVLNQIIRSVGSFADGSDGKGEVKAVFAVGR